MRPLFPNEKDKELAALYIVDIDDPECQAAIRSLLSGEPYVEFVEGEVQRKLKSPAQSSEG
ncbi:MAG: hypothetical protein HY322_00730 [Betaproteobacteria bacterium]|nr:hypothetical protein [Betaproteobacteria bacterium]